MVKVAGGSIFMKNRRSKKLGREEWGRRAQAIVDRPAPDAHTQIRTESPKSRPKISQRLHDMAHEEWMKGAQGVVGRLPAALPDYVPLPLASVSHFADDSLVEKPGRGEWIKWATIVVDRLTT